MKKNWTELLNLLLFLFSLDLDVSLVPSGTVEKREDEWFNYTVQIVSAEPDYSVSWYKVSMLILEVRLRESAASVSTDGFLFTRIMWCWTQSRTSPNWASPMRGIMSVWSPWVSWPENPPLCCRSKVKMWRSQVMFFLMMDQSHKSLPYGYVHVPGAPVIRHLSKQRSEDGKHKVLVCEAEGSPKPEVFWSINGTSVRSGS